MKLENTTEHDITINWIGGSVTVPHGRPGTGKVKFINGTATIEGDLWKALSENDPVVAAWEAGGDLIVSADDDSSGQAMTEVERKLAAAQSAAMKVAAKRIASGAPMNVHPADQARAAAPSPEQRKADVDVAAAAAKAQSADDDKKKRG